MAVEAGPGPSGGGAPPPSRACQFARLHHRKARHRTSGGLLGTGRAARRYFGSVLAALALTFAFVALTARAHAEGLRLGYSENHNQHAAASSSISDASVFPQVWGKPGNGGCI